MKLLFKPHKCPGKLIVFCGLDGSGKTTMINHLKNELLSMGHRVAVTKQPTDAVRKSDIFRTFMDKSDHGSYPYRALSLLCASDRIQHCEQVIIPLLEQGQTVICDRYYFSCLANLIARGYPGDKWIYEISACIPRPDISFFLDVDTDVAGSRVHSRPDERNRYIDAEFQKKLRSVFKTICSDNDGVLISTERPLKECLCRIFSEVKGIMANGEK